VPDCRYIYAFRDPRTGEARYVGVACDMRKRFAHHKHLALHGDQTHKATWLRSLFAEGLIPDVDILEVVPADAWMEAERKWISHFRAEGCDLTNLTDGGEGTTGHRATEETRARQRAAHVGRPKSEAHKAAIAAARKGHVKSAEHRARLSAALKGRVPVAANTARLAKYQKGVN
jgi:hypothetical protein